MHGLEADPLAALVHRRNHGFNPSLFPFDISRSLLLFIFKFRVSVVRAFLSFHAYEHFFKRIIC